MVSCFFITLGCQSMGDFELQFDVTFEDKNCKKCGYAKGWRIWQLRFQLGH